MTGKWGSCRLLVMGSCFYLWPKREGKNSVRNLRYRPRARLVRGMYNCSFRCCKSDTSQQFVVYFSTPKFSIVIFVVFGEPICHVIGDRSAVTAFFNCIVTPIASQLRLRYGVFLNKKLIQNSCFSCQSS